MYRDGSLVGTTASTNYSDTGLQPGSLHSYWVNAFDAADNVSNSSAGVSAKTDYGADQFGTTWKPLRIGAGGYITGIDITSDGTKVVRTDTYGAYIWDGTQWDQLITSNSMPAAFVNTQLDNSGVYEIAIAPSNTNILYMEFLGYVFKSTNRGATWSKTNFAQVTDGSNDSYRTYGRKMAIDPANPNVVYVGTPDGGGLFVTTDGGTSWSEVTGIANSTDPGYAIAFDPTSSVVGGETQGIYVGSEGTGIYHSTNGGGSWTLTSGTPTAFSHMVVAQDGVLYLADDVDNNLKIYSLGSWSSVSVGSNGNPLYAIAVDPSNANRIAVVNAAGNISVSPDHAATFAGYSFSNSLTATDVPWLAGISSAFLSTGDIAFDPSESNTLYLSAGYGIWVTNPFNTFISSVAWSSQSKGIEQLVTNTVISPPGGHPLVGVDDRGVFELNNPDVFPLPSAEGPTSTPFSQFAAWDLDYASNNPNYISGLINWATIPPATPPMEAKPGRNLRPCLLTLRAVYWVALSQRHRRPIFSCFLLRTTCLITRLMEEIRGIKFLSLVCPPVARPVGDSHNGLTGK